MNNVKHVISGGAIGATAGVVPGWLVPIVVLYPCQFLPVSSSAKKNIGFFTSLLAFVGCVPASIGGAIGGAIGGLTNSNKSVCARNGVIGGIALPIVGVVALVIKDELYPITNNSEIK
jgi:hypothetical protein